MIKKCKLCKKEYKTYPCRKDKSKYCSKTCYYKDWHNTHKEPWNKGIKLPFTVWNKGTKGLCKPNQTSFKKGQKAHNYRGGLTFFNREKRWFIVCRDGRTVLFARAVLESNIKRHLKKNEVVHHINEDINDDRIENLILMTRSEHIKVHRKKIEGARKWHYEQNRLKKLNLASQNL